MDISKYEAYFHDGSLIDFKHLGSSIEILMVSAEIIPKHMLKNMPPLKEQRIRGKLFLDGVKEIKINKEILSDTIKKEYDSGSILDFEASKHKVMFGIEWTDYPPKPRKSDYSTIEIEAEKIHWENT